MPDMILQVGEFKVMETKFHTWFHKSQILK
jgi:hypothetical protein